MTYPFVCDADVASRADDSSDLLVGDHLIEYLLGRQPDPESLKRARRKFYHLAAGTAAEHRPPIFRLGPRLYAARRSQLEEWFRRREAVAAETPQKTYKKRSVAA